MKPSERIEQLCLANQRLTLSQAIMAYLDEQHEKANESATELKIVKQPVSLLARDICRELTRREATELHYELVALLSSDPAHPNAPQFKEERTEIQTGRTHEQ